MALYHRHRPQNFSAIIGEEPIVTTLSRQVAGGSVAHAYLLSGPRGVGKTTTARVLAKAVNCPKRAPGAAEPCGACSSCEAISASRAIDVIEIDAASHTGVDIVREEIIDNAQTKPTASPYKIFIIDEVHMLSTSAFNALLKTLEEPPPYVIFILATTEIHKLPATILSRCQRFDFKKVPLETMQAHLRQIAVSEGVEVEEAVLQQIAQKSEGCIRDAVTLLDQLISSGEKIIGSAEAKLLLPLIPREMLIRLLGGIIARDMMASLTALHELIASAVPPQEIADDILSHLRLLLLARANQTISALALLSEEDEHELRRMATASTLPALIELLDLFSKRRNELKSSFLPSLPIELAVIGWCHDEPTPAPTPVVVSTATLPQEDSTPSKKSVPPPPVTVPSRSPLTSTITEVQSAWQTMIKQLEIDSPSLVTILRQTTIESIAGDTIHCYVPYDFHRDKIMSPLCQNKIAGILGQLLRSDAQINVTVKAAGPAPSPELQELATAFGSDIITIDA